MWGIVLDIFLYERYCASGSQGYLRNYFPLDIDESVCYTYCRMEIKVRDTVIVGCEEFIVDEIEGNGYWVSNDDKEEWVSPSQIDAHFPEKESWSTEL